MTVIAQDDHLTAGAWAACDLTRPLEHFESDLLYFGEPWRQILDLKFRTPNPIILCFNFQ